MDPLKVWEEQVGVAMALMCEQVQQWTATCVQQLRNAQKLLPPSVPPKEKEELFPVASEEEDVPRYLKRTQEENSQELSESSSSDSFINDDEEEEQEPLSSESSSPPPPPVHRSKRVRKVPRRFSPSRATEAKKEDQKAERTSVALGKRSDTEKDQWHMVRQKTLNVQNRNKWFRSRWGDQLDMIRSGLGRESENNMGPRALWDAIGEKPERFDFRSCGVTTTKCALCGAKRMCTWKTYHDGEMHYMGVCCANLAKCWQSFSVARLNMESLAEMDELFEKVREAHVAKTKY